MSGQIVVYDDFFATVCASIKQDIDAKMEIVIEIVVRLLGS